jgi:hypothetical protein
MQHVLKLRCNSYLTAQGDPVQSAKEITDASARAAAVTNECHLNPATFVTPSVQCPMLIDLTSCLPAADPLRHGQTNKEEKNERAQLYANS